MTHLQSFQKKLFVDQAEAALISSELNQRYLCDFHFSDGYLLFVSTLLLAGCGCKVFVYPFILLILSAFYSVVCIHLPVYVYKKIKKQEVNFWKARNAFGPAIYLSLMTVMVLDLLEITL